MIFCIDGSKNAFNNHLNIKEEAKLHNCRSNSTAEQYVILMASNMHDLVILVTNGQLCLAQDVEAMDNIYSKNYRNDVEIT
jgi:hypothetical protein